MATLVDKPSAFGYTARAKWATVRVETEGATYVGRIYIPETKKRVSDLLCDDRPFLSMTDVTINDSHQVEPFVALNKTFVKCVRVINEGDVEPVSGRSR